MDNNNLLVLVSVKDIAIGYEAVDTFEGVITEQKEYVD